jgi:hypothetical protein
VEPGSSAEVLEGSTQRAESRHEDREYPASEMKFLRRAIFAIFMMVITATVFRLRGTGGTPPQHGGWRPLDLPER